MKQYFQCEIMTEVAWQLGDTNSKISRAESRWNAVDIALDIIRGNLLADDAEDIDHWVAKYLHEKGYTTT